MLAPLESQWDTLDPESRRRWLRVAERYPAMPPERQQRIQQRMVEWAALSPEGRAKARERYRKLPPGQRRDLRQRWEEYQQLPEDQRKKLREGAAPDKQ